MDVQEKLEILADAAKYDVACTSSGLQRGSKAGYVGNALGAGCCHSFTPDGRCISLLKVLMTNVCVYDCAYCVNRCSNEVPRAAFTPEELADLTMAFYRRNYIEGLFLSSGVIGSPDHTTELMIRTLQLLRDHHRFRGYIHAKAVPGTSPELIDRLGHLADRMSVNLELPSQTSLSLLCPQKTKQRIIAPMRQIRDNMAQDRESRGISRRSTTYLPSTRPKERGRAFAPAGQSTQMIVGATGESDRHILTLTQSLYDTYHLKRVFYSAYVPVVENTLLPSLDTKPPLLREHRLYQADWLLRYYGFDANELLDEKHPFLNPYVDPKCNWALNHMELFPLEINRATKEELLRIPGVGVRSVQRILAARRVSPLSFEDLKKLGVVLKRAQYFITCKGKHLAGLNVNPDRVLGSLISERCQSLLPNMQGEQLSLFDNRITREDVVQCLHGQM